jgi:hypothetical protein
MHLAIHTAMKDGEMGFEVIDKRTGKSHGFCRTREKAEAQMRLLHGIDSGMRPDGVIHR